MGLRVENNKNISEIASVEESKNKKNPAGTTYTVKSGDTVYGLVKAFNFKNEQEFRDYVKMSGTAKLQKGAELTVPTVKFETTLSAIAKRYNMSVKDLMALNPQIKDEHKIQKGALINVPNKPFEKTGQNVTKANGTQNQSSAVTSNNVNSKRTQTETSENSKTSTGVKSPASENTDAETNSSVKAANSPADIAEALKKSSSKIAAVTSKSFIEAFSKINKDNVAEVIKAYDKISPDESLINMICSEVGNRFSKGNPRKDAVIKIYDMLAKHAGVFAADANVRNAFEGELDSQFGKLFGMVSTEKLDKIINSLVDGKHPEGIEYVKAPGNTKVVIAGKETDFTVDKLHEDWNKNAKKWNRTAERPRPSVDTSGKPVAEIKVYQPVQKGVLSGKTIIVNPGHGGIMGGESNNSLNFDPGTSNAAIAEKKVNGNKIEVEKTDQFIGNGGQPLEEWEVNQTFAKELTAKLTKQGAKVVYISGSVRVAPESISKYRKDADMIVSLHADSSGNKDGIVLVPTNTLINDVEVADEDDAAFAKVIQENLDSDAAFKGLSKVRDQGLAVLRDTDRKAYKGPDILIETGNLKSEKDVARLTDKKYVTSLVDKIGESIVTYLTQPQKKNKTNTVVKKNNSSKYRLLTENPAHTVKKGESLYSIAKKYGVRVNDIENLNNLKSTDLSIGQTLKIPPTVKLVNINSLQDVSQATGLSLEYIKDLKKNEDDARLGDDDFHTTPYSDKNGHLTIGVGHLITEEEMPKYKNAKLTKGEVCTLFAQDIIDKEENLKVILGAETYNKLPSALREAVLDFTFSRGEGTIKNHPGFVEALKSGNYSRAISLMNIDYSVKDGKKVYLAGMAKRRLFEMYQACKMYNGKIPKEVKSAVQAMYERGLKHLRNEYPDDKERANIKAGYDKEVKAWFGDAVTLRQQ